MLNQQINKMINQPRIPFVESLKISDLLNLNDKYINGFLDNYVKSTNDFKN